MRRSFDLTGSRPYATKIRSANGLELSLSIVADFDHVSLRSYSPCSPERNNVKTDMFLIACGRGLRTSHARLVRPDLLSSGDSQRCGWWLLPDFRCVPFADPAQ